MSALAGATGDPIAGERGAGPDAGGAACDRHRALRGTSNRLLALGLATAALLALGLRLVVLFTAQGYLRSDEAVVGMMAHHIVARGERPVFLYGQAYGGGHALVAYIAAPLFRAFGMSGTLLTAITMTFGLANVALVFRIMRRHGSPWTAWAATLLYAVAPPVLYGHFLVNGATEATFFSLLALRFFLEDGLGEPLRSGAAAPGGGSPAWRTTATLRRAALVGLFSGVAYWCMDSTLVYPITFLILWLARGRAAFARRLPPFLAGAAVGAAPTIHYDATHDAAHLMAMLPRGGEGPPLLMRAGRAFVSMWGSDLAALFHVRLDDFPRRVPLGSYLHYAVFLTGLAALLGAAWCKARPNKSGRAALGQAASTAPARSGGETERRVLKRLEATALVYVAVFCVFYSLSGFAAEVRRTPRYFLPLYPFVPIIIASGIERLASRRAACPGAWGRDAPAASGLARTGERAPQGQRRWARWAATAAVLLLAARGVYVDRLMMFRDVEHEHGIPISGRAVQEMADFLVERGIRYVLAPYELQWRLMFASRGRLVAACTGVSRLPRYEPYEAEFFERAVQGDAPYAAAFRRDFRFARLWMGPRGEAAGLITGPIWERMGISCAQRRFGEDLVVYTDFSDDFLARLLDSSEK